jgi:hypothetical protein
MIRHDRIARMKIADIVGQLKAERNKLDRAIQALAGLDGSPKTGKKRTLSAAARARIVAAQRLRWKKFKAAKKS